MHTLRRFIAESSLLKNALALISGTVATQAIVFLFSPFLARIFGPAEFGELSNYTAWVAFVSLVGSLRYEHAIIVANGRTGANRVFTLTVALSLVSVVICGALTLLISYAGLTSGYLAAIRGILPFIPLGVLFTCVSSAIIQLHVRVGLFRRLAVVGTLQVVFTVVPQIVLGLAHVPHGLVIGSITGTVFSGIALAPLVLAGECRRDIRAALTWSSMRETATKYLDFPRYTLPADAISTVVQQFAPVFVLALFSPAVAGLYSFSTRIVRVPLIVVATAVQSVLRHEAAGFMERNEGLDRLYRTTVLTLFAVSIIPFLLLAVYGHEIFAVIFGDKWRDAGTVVRILSPGILCEFVAFPLPVFFLLTGTQRYTFRIQAAGFAALVLALFAGKHLLNDFMATCYLFSVALVAVNVTTIALAGRVARGTARRSVASPVVLAPVPGNE